MSSLVKFYSGNKTQLEQHAISNGAVYFIPDVNHGLGNIAFDLNGVRTWVMAPKIITLNDLDNSVPKYGELIVVTDALSTMDEETEVVTTSPGLKIGDGVTTVSALPYLNDNYGASIEMLEAQYELLSNDFSNHISDTDIHHTKNAEVETNSLGTYTLKILNYDL